MCRGTVPNSRPTVTPQKCEKGTSDDGSTTVTFPQHTRRKPLQQPRVSATSLPFTRLRKARWFIGCSVASIRMQTGMWKRGRLSAQHSFLPSRPWPYMQFEGLRLSRYAKPAKGCVGWLDVCAHWLRESAAILLRLVRGGVRQ